MNRILDSSGMIRLVKGAYNESPKIALKRKNQINENFSKLMRLMFERGEGFAIATHHEKLIEEATELSKTRQVDFEFEMLMGIRDKKKIELARLVDTESANTYHTGKGGGHTRSGEFANTKATYSYLRDSLVSG